MFLQTIGIPKESKIGEKRVALTPSHVCSLVERGHTVWIETGAGTSAGFEDEMYLAHGASVAPSKQELYERASLIVKVKEPTEEDLPFLHSKHVLFCYLHLAAFPKLTKVLLDRKITCIAFESIIGFNRTGNTLPLLAPMSSIAGKLAIHMAHDVLRQENGELIGSNTNIHIIGAGTVGTSALQVAEGLGAKVTLYDISRARLNQYTDRATTVCLSDSPNALNDNLCDPTSNISIVVCGALKRDDLAPRLISSDVVKRLNAPEYRPTVFVDVSIDQGGCIEGIKQTSLHQPWYKDGNHFFIAVPNMPGSVPKTASVKLADAIFPYVEALRGNMRNDTGLLDEYSLSLYRSLNTGVLLQDGYVVNDTLRELYGKRGEKIP